MTGYIPGFFYNDLLSCTPTISFPWKSKHHGKYCTCKYSVQPPDTSPLQFWSLRTGLQPANTSKTLSARLNSKFKDGNNCETRHLNALKENLKITLNQTKGLSSTMCILSKTYNGMPQDEQEQAGIPDVSGKSVPCLQLFSFYEVLTDQE